MTPRWGGQIHDFTLMRGSIDDAETALHERSAQLAARRPDVEVRFPPPISAIRDGQADWILTLGATSSPSLFRSKHEHRKRRAVARAETRIVR